MLDKRSLKLIAFKVAGALSLVWAVYWLHGTRLDMAGWFDQGEYSNVIFTVLIGLAPLLGWLHAIMPEKPKDG